MRIEDLDPDDLIGAIKFESKWRFFAGTVAEWVLDYAAYDPYFEPSKSRTNFRNNLLKVDEPNALEFILAMHQYELSQTDIRQLLERDGSANWPLQIIVDFDALIYVNGFHEIALHQYVPAGWKGTEDIPLKYLPDELARLWTDFI